MRFGLAHLTHPITPSLRARCRWFAYAFCSAPLSVHPWCGWRRSGGGARRSPFISRRSPVSRTVSHGAAVRNRLLLVDDSEMSVRLMKHLLTRAGFVCEQAANGEIAVAVWKREIAAGRHFDATFMDKVCARMQCCMSSDGACGCVRARCCLHSDGACGAVVRSANDRFPAHSVLSMVFLLAWV